MATKFAKCLRKITQGRDTSRVTTAIPHGDQLFVFYASTGGDPARDASCFAGGIADEKLEACPTSFDSVS